MRCNSSIPRGYIEATDLPVELSITPKDAIGFQVKGTLPKSLENDYARISISAEAQKNCKGEGGWLVNIAK